MPGSAKSTPVAQQLGSNQGCVAILGDLVLHSQCTWGMAWRRTAVCLVTNAEPEPVYFSAVVSRFRFRPGSRKQALTLPFSLPSLSFSLSFSLSLSHWFISPVDCVTRGVLRTTALYQAIVSVCLPPSQDFDIQTGQR